MLNFLLFLLLSTNPMRIDYIADHRVDNFNINNRGHAIDYYDPISFYNGEPRIGLESIPFTYNGVTYLFFSEENKAKFLENHKDLEPRFGGWCAYSMTEGKKVNFEPEYFDIINDSLYLFKDEESKIKFKNNYKELNIKAWDNWVKILPTFDPRDSIYRMK